jgi:hypothetical protein
MELGLNDFLTELGRETVSKIDNVKKVTNQTKTIKQETNVHVPKRETKKIEPINEEPKQQDDNELNEEFIEDALDYANVIIKTVRKNFETSPQRKKILESIRSAINIYLGDQGSINPIVPIQTNISKPQEIKINDLTGQQVNIQNNKEDFLSNDLNIGVKVNSEGKKEADLSQLTSEDIHSLRVLSGVENIDG